VKVSKLTTLYPAYTQRFYAEHRADLPHAAQKEALDLDAFGWADFWSHALGKLGYAVQEISANVAPLQRAWALENGLAPDAGLLEIAAEQVVRFQPDVLFLDDYVTFGLDWIRELKARCPSIHLTIGWCGAPFKDESPFKAYDLTLSCIPELVARFEALGHRAMHMNHAFDPRILARLDLDAPLDIDFSFVGNIVRSNRYHLKREETILELARALPIEVFMPMPASWVAEDLKHGARQAIYGAMALAKASGIPATQLARLPKLGRAAAWEEAPMRTVNPRLRSLLRPGVFGLAMYQTLRRSRCTFNSHIDVSRDSASNMRLYESTGVGTCLVTDAKSNLAALFEPDREVVTYGSPAECIEKVRWLLDHPAERDAIAQRGQARTLRDHTFDQRALQLDGLIKRYMP
jgi:hypothetical protein